MDVVLSEEILVDAEFLRMRARVAERGLRGFLHHLAELAGKR